MVTGNGSLTPICTYQTLPYHQVYCTIDFITDMNQYGSFSYSDYDVMDRSCNTFTYELSKRLHLSEKYPVGILNQSKMGELLAPVVHAIDILGQDHLLSSWSSGASTA